MKKNIKASGSVSTPSIEERRKRAVKLTAHLMAAEHQRRLRCGTQTEEVEPVTTAGPAR